MKIYKRPILAFFYCETSRLVSITNDRQERKFKIHRSVENSKRWKSDPKKSISWQNFYFWFPSEPSPRSPNAANLKGFLFQSGVHLKDATNQWLLWSLPAAGKKSKQSLSKVRSNAKLIPHERNLGIWGRSQSWKILDRWIGVIGVDR